MTTRIFSRPGRNKRFFLRMMDVNVNTQHFKERDLESEWSCNFKRTYPIRCNKSFQDTISISALNRCTPCWKSTSSNWQNGSYFLRNCRCIKIHSHQWISAQWSKTGQCCCCLWKSLNVYKARYFDTKSIIIHIAVIK